VSRPSTLVILVALAALVGIAVYFDRARPTTDEHRRATTQLFPKLDPSLIDRVGIERRGVTLSLERKNSAWWLGDGTRAADASVEAILSTLSYGQVERVLDDSLRAQSGVEAPRVHLTASGGPVPVDLRIGADAAGRGVYVARGPELLVAEHHLVEVSDLDAVALRSRAPALDDPAAAATLQIGPLGLERHGGGWRIIEPKPALADADKVGALVTALGRARADSLSPGPPPPPAPGDQTLAFDGKLQARIRWTGCGKMPQVIRSDGAVLCFAESALEPLRATVDQLRETHLTAFRLEEVDAADFEAGGRALSLRRGDHAWRITSDGAAPADDAAVRERLKSLLDLRARAFGPPGAERVGRLRLGAGGETVELELFRAGHEISALRKGEDLALLLPGTAMKLLDADPLGVRSRRVDTFRPDQVSAIAADGANLHRGDEKVARLVEALSDLHAESLQHRRVTAQHTLRITAAGTIHSFTLGLRDQDGCLVSTNDPQVAYVIAPDTCSVLYAAFD
jgi:hypothetical protein